VATLEGTDSDRDLVVGELVDRPASSSLASSSDEISTMRNGVRWWFGSRGKEVVAVSL